MPLSVPILLSVTHETMVQGPTRRCGAVTPGEPAQYIPIPVTRLIPLPSGYPSQARSIRKYESRFFIICEGSFPYIFRMPASGYLPRTLDFSRYTVYSFRPDVLKQALIHRVGLPDNYIFRLTCGVGSTKEIYLACLLIRVLIRLSTN